MPLEDRRVWFFRRYSAEAAISFFSSNVGLMKTKTI